MKLRLYFPRFTYDLKTDNFCKPLQFPLLIASCKLRNPFINNTVAQNNYITEDCV